MDHFLYQGMHLPVPCTVFFVVHAVFQITQYMCKAFLVAGSILIKGYIMIVDQCPLIVFNDRALYSIVSLFAPGKIEHTAIRNRTYKYIRTFPVYTGIGTVCMHDRGKQHVTEKLFALGFCFFCKWLAEIIDHAFWYVYFSICQIRQKPAAFINWCTAAIIQQKQEST